MDYYDYFKEQSHNGESVDIDEFIAEAMRTDLKFNNIKQELHYEHSSRITLKNEILTCYDFLKQQGLLQTYKMFREGK